MRLSSPYGRLRLAAALTMLVAAFPLAACTQTPQQAPVAAPTQQSGSGFSTMNTQQLKAALSYIKSDTNIPPESKKMAIAAIKSRLAKVEK